MEEKEKIIKKLLRKKAITKKEAAILLAEKKPIEYVPYVPYTPPQPFKMIDVEPYVPSIPLPYSQDRFETCGCNPKNGGSGICNCTLSSPVIYCSTNQVNSVTPKNVIH